MPTTRAQQLVPVGRSVKRSASYLQNRKDQRGAGWSDDQRRRFKVWEEQEAAERWTVAEHLPPQSEHNAGLSYAYRLTQGGRVMYAQTYDWTEA